MALTLNRLTRRLWRSDNGLGREVEGNAEDVCVFDVEEIIVIEVVGLAAQRASDDLFAEELGTKSADAEDVGDGVRIPALPSAWTRRQHSGIEPPSCPCFPTVFVTSRSNS